MPAPPATASESVTAANVHPARGSGSSLRSSSLRLDPDVVSGGTTLSKYRMYVDEVGNADLRSSDDPNHRFLSLSGVVIELGHVESTVHPRMEALKSTYFGSHPDDPVILHRKDLVNRRGRFASLRDPAVNIAFDRALGLMEYTVISVCLDKQAHRERYTVWRYDPYHYCLAVLLERYVYFLNRRAAGRRHRGVRGARRTTASRTPSHGCARGIRLPDAQQIGRRSPAASSR